MIIKRILQKVFSPLPHRKGVGESLFLFSFLLLFVSPASAQDKVTLTGSIQSDIMLPQNDSIIGAEKTEDVVTNTYVTLQLNSKYVDAGARLEYLEHPMPGYEGDFKGWGVPHFYVKGRLGMAELTAGTFYEQFGSGFILRTYEERSLGIDNSLLGGRLVLKPTDGVTVKLLSGKQRRYWSWNKSLVSGADAEVNLDELMASLRKGNTRLMVGASWVNKHERQEEILVPPTYQYRYNLPEFVNAWDVRANLNKGPWSDDFTIGEGDTRTLEYQQTIDAAWNASCLSVVAFVYNDEGVQQAVKARVEN